MEELGIEGLMLEGPLDVSGVNVLGKGCDSIVVKAFLDGKPVALKVRRTDSHVKSLFQEGINQKIANSVGVGAKIRGFSNDFIAMELVEGDPIGIFASKAQREHLAVTLRDLIGQCRSLDAVGLDHGELSRAHRHVIVTAQFRPVLLDFGSSSIQRRTSNVSSILSFLFFSKNEVSRSLIQKLNAPFEEGSALKALREYKRSLSEESFYRVLKELPLKE